MNSNLIHKENVLVKFQVRSNSLGWQASTSLPPNDMTQEAPPMYNACPLFSFNRFDTYAQHVLNMCAHRPELLFKLDFSSQKNDLSLKKNHFS